MCQVLGVNSNSYYRFAKRHRDRLGDPDHHARLSSIQDIAKASDDTYGSRRMARAMRALGYPHGSFKSAVTNARNQGTSTLS